MDLNQEFLVEVFYTYCKRPTSKRYQNVYNAECPICKEGKSKGRSRRLFYFPSKQYFYCHNCSKAWKPFDWVKEVTGMTVAEILRKNKEKSNGSELVNTKLFLQKPEQPAPIPDLPDGSVDLTNPTEVAYFASNRVVQAGIEYCNNRRLFTAVNSCKKFYVCLEDKVHKNRLVIPFFDELGKVICYQTRALDSKVFPRYLTKYGEKSIFNYANIDSSIPYVFVFEGPIDSMFVQNGVAIAALSPTEKQEQILASLIGYELIYVFDNDKNNKQVAKRIEGHIKSGKRVFIWPQQLKEYKDFNEACCNLKVDGIPYEAVVKNSYKGPEALIKFKLACK